MWVPSWWFSWILIENCLARKEAVRIIWFWKSSWMRLKLIIQVRIHCIETKTVCLIIKMEKCSKSLLMKYSPRWEAQSFASRLKIPKILTRSYWATLYKGLACRWRQRIFHHSSTHTSHFSSLAALPPDPRGERLHSLLQSHDDIAVFDTRAGAPSIPWSHRSIM